MIEMAFAVGGAALVMVVLWDVFVTIFSTAGGGPLTTFGFKNTWRVLLAVHHRKPIHHVLALSGPLMLLVGIAMWHVLLGIGWFFLFASSDRAVINNLTSTGAGALDTAYFVGSTISSLGYGDFVPSGFPWTLTSGVAALVGTIVLTTSLSYVLSVLNAGIDRKSLAEEIFGLGENVPDFVENLWHGGSPGFAERFGLGIAGQINRHAQQHMSYPILRFFHSAAPTKSAPRAVLLASDAFFLLGHAYARERRPPRSLLRAIESSIGQYAGLTTSGLAVRVPSEHEVPAHLRLEALRARGHETVADEEFREAFRGYLPLRERLVALCRESGWGDGPQVEATDAG